MILDEVIKRWSTDSHDFSEDEAYLQYARYVVSMPWIKGLKRHLAALWVAFLLVSMSLIAEYPSLLSVPVGRVLLQIFGYLGVMSLSFILYGIKKYNLQDGSTLLCYAMMVMGLGFYYGKLPEVWQAVFAVVMLPVSFWLHYLVPARFRKLKKEMKQFHAEKEKEAQNWVDMQERDEFDRWSDQLWGGQAVAAEAVVEMPAPELPCIAEPVEQLPEFAQETYEELDDQPYEAPVFAPVEVPYEAPVYEPQEERYEEPEEIPAPAESRPDYLMETARAMFEGIEMTQEALRERYDQLIQTYCMGEKGDEQLIECIDEVYNELFEVISQ